MVAGLFWGLGFPLGKLALREVGPAHLMLWRFAAASLAASPFAFRDASTRAVKVLAAKRHGLPTEQWGPRR